jgi:hypothetical protein
VDIAPSETLSLSCEIRNHTNSDLVLDPTFATYYRTEFGALSPDAGQPQQSVVLKANATQTFTVSLPKALVPQAYDVKLTFTDPENIPANSVITHYVLRGSGATIQNLTLDKTAYNAGDTAKATLFWTGPADAFMDSRGGASSVSGMRASIGIRTINGGSCAADVTTPLNPGGFEQNIPLSISSSCISPAVAVAISDSSGTVIASSTFSFISTTTPPSHSAPILGVILSLVVVLGVGYGIFRMSHGRSIGFFLIVISMPVTLLFFMPGQARADTIWLVAETYRPDMDLYIPQTIYFTMNIDKSVYSPGETMYASGDVEGADCSNALVGDITSLINGEQKYVYQSDNYGGGLVIGATYNTFTAPTAPGTYQALFYPELHVPPNADPSGASSYFCLQGTYNNWAGACTTGWLRDFVEYSNPYPIDYTVIAPPPSCWISVSPAGTVGEGTTQTIYWQGAYAYSGESLAIYHTPWNGSQYLYWAGPVGDNPSGSAGKWPTGSWTYVMSVSNASGSNSCQTSWTVKPKPSPDSFSPNGGAECPGIGDVLTVKWNAGQYALNHLVVVDDKSNGWSASANCTNGTGFNPGDWCGYVTSTDVATPSQSGHTYDISVYSSNDVGLGTPVKTTVKCPSSNQCTDDGTRICYNDTVVNKCGQTQQNCTTSGDICQNGSCVAPSSCVASSYTCADSTHRKDNCNNISACPSGQTCTGGVCSAALCTVSAFSCASTASRVDNCGNVYMCAAGQTCSGGVCYSAPQLTLSAVPLLVQKLQPTDLSWTSAGAASCKLVGTNGDDFTGISSAVSTCTHGTGAFSGACVTSDLSRQTTYTLTCTSAQGAISNKSVSINILPTFCEPGQDGC